MKTILNHIFVGLCLIGLIGNLIALVIFGRKKFANTIFSTYFRLLCLFNILTLLTRIDYFILVYGLKGFRDIIHVTCKLTYYFNYATSSISSWILVVISLDRFVSIVMPSKFMMRKKIQFQLLILAFVFICNMFLFAPILITSDLTNKTLITNNQTVITCRKNSFIYDLFESICSTFIPFIIMFISTLF